MGQLPAKTQRVYDAIHAYSSKHRMSPSYRELVDDLGYKSLAGIQHHLDRLEQEGLITRSKDQTARSIQLVHPDSALPTPSISGIPIYGAIAASGFVEVFDDAKGEYIEPNLFLSQSGQPERFGLRVWGDSMIGALIDQGDIVILEKPTDPKTVKNGTIVAARVEGKTTLKRWHRQGNQVALHPENPNYPVMQVPAEEVVIEGVYVGIVRGLL